MKCYLALSIILQLFFIAVCAKDTDYQRMPHLFALDDYDSCLKATNGVYCLAQFELFGEPGNELIELIKDHSADIVNHYNYSLIDKGVCLTKSCKQYLNNNVEKAVDLKAPLEECINDMIWKEYKINSSVAAVYNCDRRDQHLEIDALDWTVAGVFVVLIALVFVGSYHDFKIRKMNETKQTPNGNKYLLCFSIFQNLENLFSRERDDFQFQSLRELDGFRCMVLSITIFAHMFLMMASFTDDPHTLEKANENAAAHILFNGMMVVQVFFFLSGFMLAFLLRTQEARGLPPDAATVILHRWWRLGPVYAAMVAFMATWLRHVGEGPLWHLGMVLGTAAHCRRRWWAHLLFIKNMFEDDKLCMFQAWHVTVDMQMFVVGVVAHTCTRRRGRALALALLLALGMLTAAASVLAGYAGFLKLTPQFMRTMCEDLFYHVHTHAATNLPSFVIGMSTGYLGYNLQENRKDHSGNTLLRILSWLMIPLFMVIIYSGRALYTRQGREWILGHALYAASHRAAFGLLSAAWVLAVMCRCNDISRWVFSWRGWAACGKLCYCVYLLHIVFLHLSLGLRRALLPVSFPYAFKITFLVVVISYAAAVPLYLVVEAPFYRLAKTIFAPHRQPKQVLKKTL